MKAFAYLDTLETFPAKSNDLSEIVHTISIELNKKGTVIIAGLAFMVLTQDAPLQYARRGVDNRQLFTSFYIPQGIQTTLNISSLQNKEVSRDTFCKDFTIAALLFASCTELGVAFTSEDCSLSM